MTRNLIYTYCANHTTSPNQATNLFLVLLKFWFSVSNRPFWYEFWLFVLFGDRWWAANMTSLFSTLKTFFKCSMCETLWKKVQLLKIIREASVNFARPEISVRLPLVRLFFRVFQFKTFLCVFLEILIINGAWMHLVEWKGKRFCILKYCFPVSYSNKDAREYFEKKTKQNCVGLSFYMKVDVQLLQKTTFCLFFSKTKLQPYTMRQAIFFFKLCLTTSFFFKIEKNVFFTLY